MLKKERYIYFLGEQIEFLLTLIAQSDIFWRAPFIGDIIYNNNNNVRGAKIPFFHSGHFCSFEVGYRAIKIPD
jgi:hypothetical protein